MNYRAQVVAVTTAGVYVRCPAITPEPFGPLQVVGATPAVGDRVLVADTGDTGTPDLVVITGSGLTSDTTGNLALSGAPSNFGATSRVLQVNSGEDGYAAVLADGEGRTLQMLASDFHGVAAVGTRSAHPLTICVGDTTRITVSTTGRVTLAAAGPTAGIELGTSGPTITTGTGAPTHSAPNGSLYTRTDGGAGTTLYVRESGAWVGK